MRMGSWNYKVQDPKQFRHYGPMAQDFFAAFGNDGIGFAENDTTIASADFDGINMIAIKALERRTQEVKHQLLKLERTSALNEQLEGRNKRDLIAKIATLENQNATQEARLKKLEQQLKELTCK